METKTIVGFKEKPKSSHYVDSDGYEIWTDYDEFGHPIHFKCSEEFECWGWMKPSNPMEYTYTDNNGNVLTETFDDHGNAIKFDILGGEKSDLYFRYDKFGIPVECISSKHSWVGIPDSDDSRLYHYVDDEGYLCHKRYDKNCNVIRYDGCDGSWYKVKYDYRTVIITDDLQTTMNIS